MPTCKGGINMKRLSKKFFALLMAMTMVLAMGVTANATGTPTLQINDGNGIQTVDYTMPTSNLYPNIPDNAENKGYITAADILLAGAQTGDRGSVSAQLANGNLVAAYDQYYLNADGKAGLYISKYWGKDTINNYQYIGYDEEKGLYTYRWTGSYWSLSIDEGNGMTYASSYATAYKASDITGIKFEYITDNVGYEFTTPNLIPGATGNPESN